MDLKPFDSDTLHALQRRRALEPRDEAAKRGLIEYTQASDSDLWMYVGATANTADSRKIEQYGDEAKKQLVRLTDAGFRLTIRDARVLASASPRDVSWETIDTWAPQFVHVTRLSFTDDELCFEEGSSDHIAQLLLRDEARGLTFIELAGTGLSAAFGAQFADANLPNLVELYVYWEALRMEGLAAIASNPTLESLRSLRLTFCGYGGRPGEPETDRMFARALGNASFAGSLRELELKELFVGAAFVEELVEQAELTRGLESLDLSSDGEGWNDLGEDGVRALARCETFEKLTTLRVGNCGVPDDAIVHLAVGRFPALDTLQIGWAQGEWKPDAMQTLDERFHLILHD